MSPDDGETGGKGRHSGGRDTHVSVEEVGERVRVGGVASGRRVREGRRRVWLGGPPLAQREGVCVCGVAGFNRRVVVTCSRLACSVGVPRVQGADGGCCGPGTTDSDDLTLLRHLL